VDYLTITDIDYVNTTSLYNKVYQDFARKGISMVNGSSKYEVPISSGSMLKTYSLKSSNFNKYLSKPYYSMNNCVNDLASRSSSYRNYRIVDSYYR